MRRLCIIAVQLILATLCIATPSEHRVVGLAVIKQPRVGSTWVKKEFNSLPGVHLEFEPLTDGAHRCPVRAAAMVEATEVATVASALTAVMVGSNL